jgi:steroid 5-alpha reductase family enzyme
MVNKVSPRLSKNRSLLICLGAYAAAAAAAAAVCGLTSGWSPVWSAAAADAAATLVVFGFSIGVDNSSMYDPYWSAAPAVIAPWWLARLGGFVGPTAIRQAVVLALVLAWAVRLTWNWMRRWRGLQDEDWRYADYRRLGPMYWPVSFLGFHLMPTVLVFVGCLSLLTALSPVSRALNVLDLAALVVAGGAILVETAADRQLWGFLAVRRRGQILDTGLWALSRHPNYFGEVAFWWGLWLFGLAGDPSRWWTVVGPLGITALFLGISVPMMDKRMLARHPNYAAHMSRRSAFLPWVSQR